MPMLLVKIHFRVLLLLLLLLVLLMFLLLFLLLFLLPFLVLFFLFLFLLLLLLVATVKKFAVGCCLGFVRSESTVRSWGDKVVAALIVLFAFTLLALHQFGKFAEGISIGGLAKDILEHGHEPGIAGLFVVKGPQRPGSRVAIVFESLVHSSLNNFVDEFFVTRLHRIGLLLFFARVCWLNSHRLLFRFLFEFFRLLYFFHLLCC